jgi:hypothetical protein
MIWVNAPNPSDSKVRNVPRLQEPTNSLFATVKNLSHLDHGQRWGCHTDTHRPHPAAPIRAARMALMASTVSALPDGIKAEVYRPVIPVAPMTRMEGR